jgi:glycosyltransferase involved in cell wall biosynthesis
MRILFYEKMRRRPSAGEWTHIFEVLNNLSRLGHSIVWVDGQNYCPVEDFDIQPGSKQRQSLWQRGKAFVMTLPLRGESILLGSLLKEAWLLLTAFGTALRHKPDVIYRRHTLFNSEYFLAKLFRIPSVKEVNGLIADSARTGKLGDRFSMQVFDWIEHFSMPKADRIIVVASKMKKVLHKDYNIPENKIVWIENGANTDLFKPMDAKKARNELNLDQSEHYICFVGQFWRTLGIDCLIKSLPYILEKCPQTRFLVVGGGGIKEELIELAEQLNVSDKVIFTGIVPYHRVPLYINASDICVAPFIKKRNERTGVSALKIYEYGACGKPIVTSRLPGLEFVEQSGAGVLVDPDSPEELAEAIMKLIQNPELRKQMGANGRKHVVEGHSWESVARRVGEVCQQALENYRR